MTVTIEGIELTGRFNVPGTAYFKQDDHECEISGTGEFKDQWGAAYRVLWPIPHTSLTAITVERLEWRTVGRVESDSLTTVGT